MKLKTRIKFLQNGYGGAEGSYLHLMREIEDDPRLSRKRKRELQEKVTFLVNHIMSDAYRSINHQYDSAYCSGVKHVKWMHDEQPSKWWQRLNYEALRHLRMSLHLSDMGIVSQLKSRMEKMQTLIEERVLK